ncbi:MAG: hypothetical protein A2Y73_01270 [Chloroflexi bacterium RBG_13_56_8]|nr:MAG: hypothetical protein A2Y73_01270 [Chloroflexi bacterium RBG_13_56_8]
MQVIDSSEPGFPEAEAWDGWVAQDARGHLLQTWAWGELKGAFGWHPIRLAVEQDGVLMVGAQVLYRKMGPFTLGYIPKGPVLAHEEPEAVEMLWQALHAQARRMHAICLKVEPEWRDEEMERHKWLESHGLRLSPESIQPRRTILVDLRDSEDEILARMKSKWRYNVRLSERRGVEVRVGGLEDMPTFYDLMCITGKRDQFGVHTLAYYRRALALFSPTDRVRLFIAYYQDQPVAGLMAYAFNRQSWYMYGASSDVYRELMPNHQLQWRAMQWAKEKGCVQYDLWGIPDGDLATESLEGVHRFKAGFGGEVVRYVGSYDYVYSPPLYWAMRQAWAYRRKRSRQALS